MDKLIIEEYSMLIAEKNEKIKNLTDYNNELVGDIKKVMAQRDELLNNVSRAKEIIDEKHQNIKALAQENFKLKNGESVCANKKIGLELSYNQNINLRLSKEFNELKYIGNIYIEKGKLFASFKEPLTAEEIGKIFGRVEFTVERKLSDQNEPFDKIEIRGWSA